MTVCKCCTHHHAVTLLLTGGAQVHGLFLGQKQPCESDTGDHLYRMDYGPFVQKHRESGADITVAALPMDAARAEAFGVMKVHLTHSRLSQHAVTGRTSGAHGLRLPC